MKCPLFLHIAFFLGLNPYSRITSHKISQICAVSLIIYMITYGSKFVLIIITKSVSSATIFSVFYRSFIACFFVSVGLFHGGSRTVFYDEMLNEIEPSSRKKVFAFEDLWCLILILAILPENFIINEDFDPIFLLTYFFKVAIPLISMLQFSLCCTSVQFLYRQLQTDMVRYAPKISSFTLRRIRVRHLDIADRVRNLSTAFGVRQLLYIVMIQVVLLEKVDDLANQVASQACGGKCLMVFASFCGYFLNLWYFSYRPFRAACEHQESLASLMDLDTRDLELSAIQEMAQLAEDLNSWKTQFSAAGCFYVGFNIFYSVIGIIFSYLMIIGPMAYNKNKHLW